MVSAFGSSAKQRAGEHELRAAHAGSDHDKLGVDHAAVDQHGPITRQADRRDPAVLHARQFNRTLHQEKRRLANIQSPPHHPVDVRTSGRQHDAGCEALGSLALAPDYDTVGEHVGLQPVLLLRGGRVRHRRIDLDHADALEQAARLGEGSLGWARQQIRPEGGRHGRERAELVGAHLGGAHPAIVASAGAGVSRISAQTCRQNRLRLVTIWMRGKFRTKFGYTRQRELKH